MTMNYNVVGVGNAVVDVLVHVDEKFLVNNGIKKGVMQLVDSEWAIEFYSKIHFAEKVSGGSVANTVVALSQLGLNTAYIGKVKDDELGRVFQNDFSKQGVDFLTQTAGDDVRHETGRSIIFITPDGERSMCTYLGAAEFLRWKDFDLATIAQSDWLYLEGYRFDGKEAQDFFFRLMDSFNNCRVKIALTLSDPLCVDRHREAFLKLLQTRKIELLFCNQEELKSLYKTDIIDNALKWASVNVNTVVCTFSEEGALVAENGNQWIGLSNPLPVVDSTGAGDIFAAGFFYGLIHEHSYSKSVKMGCLAAAEVVGQIGARLKVDMTDLRDRLDKVKF